MTKAFLDIIKNWKPASENYSIYLRMESMDRVWFLYGLTLGTEMWSKDFRTYHLGKHHTTKAAAVCSYTNLTVASPLRLTLYQYACQNIWPHSLKGKKKIIAYYNMIIAIS